MEQLSLPAEAVEKRWGPVCMVTTHQLLCHGHFRCIYVRMGLPNRLSPLTYSPQSLLHIRLTNPTLLVSAVSRYWGGHELFHWLTLALIFKIKDTVLREKHFPTYWNFTHLFIDMGRIWKHHTGSLCCSLHSPQTLDCCVQFVVMTRSELKPRLKSWSILLDVFIHVNSPSFARRSFMFDGKF